VEVLNGKTVGFALTGSFCTFDKIFVEIENILEAGANVIPIMSEISVATDTRFGNGAEIAERLEELTGNSVVSTVKDAEPFGPKKLLDILVIAPCTEGKHNSKNSGSATV